MQTVYLGIVLPCSIEIFEGKFSTNNGLHYLSLQFVFVLNTILPSTLRQASEIPLKDSLNHEPLTKLQKRNPHIGFRIPNG